jgi:hypothetical protein
VDIEIRFFANAFLMFANYATVIRHALGCHAKSIEERCVVIEFDF